jgi:hypothetical protein
VTVKSEDIGDSGLVSPAVVPAQRVLDEEGALVETAQAERAEVDVHSPSSISTNPMHCSPKV